MAWSFALVACAPAAVLLALILVVAVRSSASDAIDVAVPQWASLSALLHLRRWQFFRDVDDGLLDLYVTPTPEDPWDYPYRPDSYNEEVRKVLDAMQTGLQVQISEIVRDLLDSPSATVTCRKAVTWEEDGTPVTGGDAYRFRFVIIDGAER